MTPTPHARSPHARSPHARSPHARTPHARTRPLRRRRTALAAALTAALTLPVLAGGTATAAAPEPGGHHRTDPSQLQRDLDALTALGITGAQTRAIGPDGRHRVATSGVADLGTGRPVSPDGHFRMGSTTKTFTATVVLQLVGEGRLSLDDTVEKWLPGLVRGNGHHGRRITVRDLLQHTSGISDVGYPSAASAADFERMRFSPTPAEKIVAAAMRHRPLFRPGKGWSYANTGYVILGMAIEKVTGRPWYTEVTRRVIEPLGLTGTSWPGRSPDLPLPHATAYQRFAPGEPLVDVTRLINVDASGGLVTTTADLNRFFRALLGGRLLRPAELRQMKETVPVDAATREVMPGAAYGLGLMSVPLDCGGSYWGHPGTDPGWGDDNGTTSDGRRSVVTSWSTQATTDLDGAKKVARAYAALTRHALCAEK
ncbi:serine hydrolase domain-containing protein [Streptomyces sp. NPDC003011]